MVSGTPSDEPVAGPGRSGLPDGPTASDTAGLPWTGRELPAQPFAADDGSADPAITALLERLSRGEAATAEVVRALRTARVLIPVVAMPGRDHPLPDHARGDLGAEMATMIVSGPGGRRTLPVFTSTQSLARWNPQARPVPVECPRAAEAAVSEDCELLVVDPAGPVTALIPRPALWALGQGRDWVPPGQDPELEAALSKAVRVVPDVLGLRLEPDGDTGVRVVLGVRAGLDRPALDAAVHAARSLIAEVELLPERAEAVRLTVLPA
jgi:hypothetical protein